MDDRRRGFNEEESGRFGNRFTPNPNQRPPFYSGGSQPAGGDPARMQPRQDATQRPFAPQSVPPAYTPNTYPNAQFPGQFGGQYAPPVSNPYPQPQQNVPPQYPPQQPFGYPQQPAGGFDYNPNMQQYPHPDAPRKKRGLFGWRKREEDYAAGNVVIAYPNSFTDVQNIIDNLRQGQSIIVDLNRINDKNSQRIMDYLSGAIYGLGGCQQRIGDNMFLFTPDGVSIQGPTDLNRKYNK